MRTFLMFLLCLSAAAWAQFSTEDYAQFLRDNADLSAKAIIDRYQPDSPFYNSRTDAFQITDFAYLDSIKIKYRLTDDELESLKNNHFVVSERLSYDCFGRALHHIYENDVPVMVTSDAILYALHFSYDRILFDIEKSLLEGKLHRVLDGLYRSFPELEKKYGSIRGMSEPLNDVDVYITMAKSLLDEQIAASLRGQRETINALWKAVEGEQMTFMPLFSERNRKLDFSQFTVRGHYTNEFWGSNGQRRTLGNYFQAMMWLGRMDFYLTPPPVGPDEQPWSREEIRRMVIGSLLLNELLDLSGASSDLQDIDNVLTFMVGESDNLTPNELSRVVASKNISPTDMFDDSIYDSLQRELLSQVNYGQRIMSAFFIVDPFSTEPDPLPVSYRLSGQRFILDSYILANVVYDRIIYQNQKIWRPMPDPLDAMFVLGNDNALPLLRDELQEYKYASQLEALRYLVDAYDDEFWSESLYNVWLQSIRQLNPSQQRGEVPYFMKTVAWQQQKLNTQLSSWTQLRHDNLLYAKQSYTGGTACSYPHSYVEPYPGLYAQIAQFAIKAETELLPLVDGNGWEVSMLKHYFPKLKEVMLKLQELAEKELRGELFNEEETDWLQRMLFIDGMSGSPPFSGWYSDLFYRLEQVPGEQYEGHDYLVADVHTQPTDQFGGVVGHVLHVGVGKVNLGIFLANSPSKDFQPMAYMGAVMSYYEKITENFKRHTDEEWADLVKADNLPERPSWVNVYLADARGNARPGGRELPGVPYTATGIETETPQEFVLLHNYPNPFNPSTALTYQLAQPEHVTLAVYDVLGKQIALLINGVQQPGSHNVTWNAGDLPSGVYFVRLVSESQQSTIKMMLVR